MTNTIKLKNSSVPAKSPLLTDLVYGEVALNYADGKLFYKRSDNTIQNIGSSAVDSVAGRTGVVTLTANDVGLANVTNESKATMFTDPTFTGTGTFSGNVTIAAYTETLQASGTVGAAATLSIDSGTMLTATLTSATPCTFTMPTAVSGKSFVLMLKQPATGTATTATFTGVKWNTLGAPVITSTLAKMDILSFMSDGVSWYGGYTQGYTP